MMHGMNVLMKYGERHYLSTNESSLKIRMNGACCLRSLSLSPNLPALDLQRARFVNHHMFHGITICNAKRKLQIRKTLHNSALAVIAVIMQTSQGNKLISIMPQNLTVF